MKLNKVQAQIPEIKTEPVPFHEPVRVTTPTPPQTDWMDVGDDGDMRNIPPVKPCVSTVPESDDVSPVTKSQICFSCNKDLTLVPRALRNRHKTKCKKRYEKRHDKYY